MSHSSDIERYTVMDAGGNERDHLYDDYEEAKSEAASIGGAVVAHRWTWDDSEMVEDFRTAEDSARWQGTR
jgi:hypothetical protein